MGGGHVSRPDFGMPQPDAAYPLTEFYLLAQRALEKSGSFMLPAPDVREEDGSVLDAIRTLPENYRNAIYLHYYEGYTAAEIGRMMAVPTNTVLSWLRRARAQLHTMLKEEIEDEVV